MPRFELSVRNASAVATNFRDLSRRQEAGVKRAVRNWGEGTQGLAYAFAPKDTWFMAEHIRLFVSEGGLVAEVGFDVLDFVNAGKEPYFVYVHEGTRVMAPRPFLKEAYDETTPVFRQDLTQALRAATRSRR